MSPLAQARRAVGLNLVSTSTGLRLNPAGTCSPSLLLPGMDLGVCPLKSWEILFPQRLAGKASFLTPDNPGQSHIVNSL